MATQLRVTAYTVRRWIVIRASTAETIIEGKHTRHRIKKSVIDALEVPYPNHRWMLWGHTEELIYTWHWGLYPLDARHTRLITRVHMRYEWTSPMFVFDLLVKFADIVMMRKCMLGIKQRAERASRQAPKPVEAVTQHQGRKE